MGTRRIAAIILLVAFAAGIALDKLWLAEQAPYFSNALLVRPGVTAFGSPVLGAFAFGVLTPAFAHYASAELGYKTDLEYHLLNRSVSGRWDFGTSPTHQGFAGALNELQTARSGNPALGALIAHGYTDLVTPYGVSQYLIDQLAPLEGARPVELKLYRGGHMMYLRPASRRAVGQDARTFYRSVLKGP